MDPELAVRFQYKAGCYNGTYEIEGRKGQISLSVQDRRTAVREHIPLARKIISRFKLFDEDATTYSADPYLFFLFFFFSFFLFFFFAFFLLLHLDVGMGLLGLEMTNSMVSSRINFSIDTNTI